MGFGKTRVALALLHCIIHMLLMAEFNKSTATNNSTSTTTATTSTTTTTNITKTNATTTVNLPQIQAIAIDEDVPLYKKPKNKKTLASSPPLTPPSSLPPSSSSSSSYSSYSSTETVTSIESTNITTNTTTKTDNASTPPLRVEEVINAITKRCIVVAPKSVLGNWEKEWQAYKKAMGGTPVCV